ncbi:hypothetical protein DPMN_098015 [Dreissena polymorpha]|uniref:Uncharacterized protein n=1 Tax=Dreissena polymorpha TaxID=45954 RepID=A0A9D4R5X2_DREPO|nr:hypothetical protein DPMN_098015 [Dreissena polymorpha]
MSPTTIVGDIKRKCTNKTDNVCHPEGYRQLKQEGKKVNKRRPASNQYTKSAFKYDFGSEDDNFV